MKKIILFDCTSDVFSRDAYNAWCEDNDFEPNDNEFYDWVSDSMEMEFNFMIEYFQREMLDKCAVLVSGQTGRWDGIHEIVPEKFNSFDEAKNSMLGGGIEDYRISQIDSTTFEFEGWHHDGKNVFTFRFLKDEFYYTDVEDLDLEGDIYEYAEETDY